MPSLNETIYGDKAQPIDSLLAERGATHGAFADHARITQRLKAVIEEELRLCKGDLNPMIDGRARITVNEEWNFIISESIDMILHKLGRIVAGDATHRDHFADIAGYAQLVVNAFDPPPTPGGVAYMTNSDGKMQRVNPKTLEPMSERIRMATQGFEEEMTRSLK